MSSVKFTNDKDSNPSAMGDSDPPIDFCNLTLKPSLSRPSDHFKRDNPYAPPPRTRHPFATHQIAARFIKDPVNTTLSSFSKVANMVWSPHEEYQNVLDLITPKTPDQFEEIDHDPRDDQVVKHPPPALPAIPCSEPQNRLCRLSFEDFHSKFESSSPCDILLRIFQGGLNDHALRRKLWPLVLGLSPQVEFDWSELEVQYDILEGQWMSISIDQENRFTSYRERKSIIERDVVRCDRTHPFFRDSSEHLELLRKLLMTYVMYDFDTGYVQGMTDLAAPLLYVWEGDIKKSFWCFVKVMELLKQNFEMSQSTISYQLQMLWKLINITDPCFAQYLGANESDNCYYAFRWIICQFKREFMKAKTDDYDDCLVVWETIWSANALCVLARQEESAVSNLLLDEDENNHRDVTEDVVDDGKSPKAETSRGIQSESSLENSSPKSSSPPVQKLKDMELFTLCICLSIIRRERDLIMANEYDACEILKHFNTLELNEDLNKILLHASSIWFWIKHDGGEEQLYCEEEVNEEKPDESTDFDLLNDDFLLLSALNV